MIYRSGELKAVAYDRNGNPAAEEIVRTAGKGCVLHLSADRNVIAGRDDLSYVTVTVLDHEGNPVPDASGLVNIKVSGAGNFKAVANGDPCCLESFQKPQMHLFSGSLCFIVEGSDSPGRINVEVSSKGLEKASLTITNKL